MTFDRTDLPESVRDLINLAISRRVIDAFYLVEIISRLEGEAREAGMRQVNVMKLVESILEISKNSRSAHSSPSTHRVLVEAAEVYFDSL